MAVNGIELKVGQVWRTRGGEEVRIDRFDESDPVMPFKADGLWYTAAGHVDEDGLSSVYDLETLLDIGQAPGKPTPRSATDLLDAAAGHMRDRAATYDKPEGERSMASTVAAFNAQTGRDLSESEGWLLLANLKVVRDRQRQQPHQDSIEDGVAYFALYGEARLKESTA